MPVNLLPPPDDDGSLRLQELDGLIHKAKTENQLRLEQVRVWRRKRYLLEVGREETKTVKPWPHL